MKKVQSINFDPDVLEWLRKEAARQDRSVSWLVNDIVKNEKDNNLNTACDNYRLR